MFRARRLAARAALALACAVAPSCGRPPDERVGLRLHLSSARGCRPLVLESVRLVALGDFSSRDERVVEADPGEPVDIDRFPANTAAISALARGGGWAGFAVAPIDPAARLGGRDALLLPLETPCPSPDPEARAPRGAAVTELDDGSLVVVGGLDELGRATSRVVRLHPGLEIATVEARMPTFRVAFGTATALDGARVLVAGGASAEDGEVREVFEVLELDEDSAARLIGTLSARRDHAAVRRGSDVILVGGSDGVRELDTIERIDVGALVAAPALARLARARRSPLALARADGSLVVAGGLDAAGPVASIEIVAADLSRSESVSFASPLPPPRWVAALPGPRLLWAGETETFVVTLEGVPEAVRLDVVAPTPEDAVATGLADGRALVVGRDGVGGPVAVSVVDPSAQTAPERRDASRAPGVLWAMADGVVVELDDVGATFRRESLLSPLDPPRASWQLPADVGALSMDAGSRWEPVVSAERGLLALADGARIDVPVLRVAYARISVGLAGAGDTAGEGEILLTSDAGVVAAIVIGPDPGSGLQTVSIGGCGVPRASAPPGGERPDVTVVRRGDSVELGGVVCTVPGLPARVGVGVRARVGSRVRSIALERLE